MPPMEFETILYAVDRPLPTITKNRPDAARVNPYDEEGVALDPHYGEGTTFYVQALATLPSVRNQKDVDRHLLELMRARAAAKGFEHISMLIEDMLSDLGCTVIGSSSRCGRRSTSPVRRSTTFATGTSTLPSTTSRCTLARRNACSSGVGLASRVRACCVGGIDFQTAGSARA